MGIEPFLIASTVRVVVGQRLVRKLCPECRESYVPDEATLKQINESFDISDAAHLKYLHELEMAALDAGIGKVTASKTNKESSAGLSTTPTKIEKLWRSHDGGCTQCNQTGYKGRVGIYEVLDNSIDMQKLIVSGATSDQIQNLAIEKGMITMQLDGFVKSLRGQTSVEEILRVTSER
jgi:type IV pilus assembly protein PilB